MQGEGKVELVRDWVAPEASLTALIALRGRVMHQVRRFVLYATPTLPDLLVACHPQGHNAKADPSPLDQSPRPNEGWIGNARLSSTLGRVKGPKQASTLIYGYEIVIVVPPLYAPPSLALTDIDDRSYQSSITLLTK